MFKKQLSRLLLIYLLGIAFSSTAHATSIDYTYTFSLALESGNAYNLDTDAYATVAFTIDSTSGNTSAAGLSMHYLAIDPSFTMSLEIGDYISSPTYTYGVTDDPSSATGFYPAVTLNTSDWSINTIDFTITDEVLGNLVVLTIEAEDTGGGSSGTPELTAGSVALSVLDPDGDGNYTIPTDSGGNITLTETASGELALANSGGAPIAAIDFSDTTGTAWTTTIPEPATFTLFGLGLFGWAWVNRRRALE